MKTVMAMLAKSAILLFILSLNSSNLFAQKLKGNGNMVSQNRDVSSFNEISVGGVMKVILIQDGTEKVTISAEENIIDYIKTKVSGHELTIGMDGNVNPTEDITVTINIKNINSLEISGVVEFETRGTLKSDNLELECSGAVKVEADIQVASLEGDISGSSKITLSGTSGVVDMDISGAVVLNAFDLKTGKCEFDISGAAKCEISCDNELEVEVSGAAKLVYNGDPHVEKSVSGVASVSKQ